MTNTNLTLPVRTFGLLLAVALAPFAHASLLTWNFASDPQFVTQGSAYLASGGTGTIDVYAEQVSGSGVLQSIPNTTECGTTGQNASFGSATCLFSTNASVYTAFESGIGPFDPTNNTQNDIDNSGFGGLYNDFVDQLGITSTNVLELVLNSDIPNGTVLSFLLQGPTYQEYSNPTTVNVYTGNYAGPENLGGAGGLTLDSGGPFGGFSPQGTTPQFMLTKTSDTEIVAIAADCDYILLDQITGTTSTVPEPRFYGLLMAALVVSGIFLRKSRRTATNS